MTKTVLLFRFEAASIQDMVTKFEPNLGFEKSFISVLALKVGAFVGREIQQNSFEESFRAAEDESILQARL